MKAPTSPPAFLVYPVSLIAAIIFYLLTAPAVLTWGNTRGIDPFIKGPLWKQAGELYYEPIYQLSEKYPIIRKPLYAYNDWLFSLLKNL